MIQQAGAFQAAILLLRDLAPYEQCRQVVQMVWDGTLTHEQGKELMYALVDDDIASANHH